MMDDLLDWKEKNEGMIAVADEASRAQIGHNRPPAYDPAVYDAKAQKVRDWLATGGEWLDLPEIETEAQAEALNDFINGARKVFKEVDDTRKAENKPHDEAIAETNKAFRALTDSITALVEKLKPKMTAFLARKKAEAEAEQARKRAEAEAARKLAEEQAAAAAARNDVMGEVEAQRLAKEAEKLAKEAEREVKANVGSATGGGRTMALRSVRKGRILNINQVFMHFRDDPRVKAVLQTCVDEAFRAKGGSAVKIPGAECYEVEGAA